MVDFSQGTITDRERQLSEIRALLLFPQPAEGRLKSGREGEHEASSQRLI
jgi:hypothetical protein